MIRRKQTRHTARRWKALVLAAGTLWAVSATAGSTDAVSAAEAFREAAAYALLRRELPGFRPRDDLSAAAVMALKQSPALYGLHSVESSDENAESDEITPPGNTSDGLTDQAGEIPGQTDQAALPPDMSGTASQTNTDGTASQTNTDGTASQTNTNGTASQRENTPEASDEQKPLPLPETPIEPAVSVDNGVRARTLIPTDSSGYTVIGNVYISSTRKDKLSISALQEPFDAELLPDGPQILILHSHGSEAYTPVPGTDVVWSGDVRTTDFRYSVVKAGDEMASVFTDAGISVIHDRTLYDYPNYTGSYDRSLAAIQTWLTQYPSIRFILDVHRDYIADSKGNQYKVVSEIDGLGTAAQMTLVMGSDGSGAAHPNWMENLKLAVAIQQQILTDYPSLMRPILLRKSRYNQHATTGSLLVEVGTAGNAPEEAFLSARLFAQEMTKVLIARSK